MKLVWDRPTERDVIFGVEKGVLYPKNSPGVVWNGLISVEENEQDSDVAVGYYDGQAYYRQRSIESYSAKITALTFPDALYSVDPFGLSYVVGDDIHLIYNAMTSSYDRSYPSQNDKPDPTIFSWNIVTTPIEVPGHRRSSHFIIGGETYPSVYATIQDLLYGTEDTDPRIPSPAELIDIFEQGALVQIVDNGDGSWSAIGPDEFVHMVDADSFQITSPTIVFLDDHTYRISSW